ncbi:ATP-dependent RNA helicase DeaD [Aphelenchoides fujianensis]|nr:ATP-dependent RNA helicase DeaD [Aphelenchoides fujianensis]
MRTEVPELLVESAADLQRSATSTNVQNTSDPGNQLLKPEQKAWFYACIGEQHNVVMYGPPETGKSTVATMIVLRAAARRSLLTVDAVILVPSVERTQKFKSLIEALGTQLNPSIYVCEEHPKFAPDEPPPAIVIGKPRQVRELIARGLIRPDELKVVVFAQVHKMLGAAYREDPHEVLRSLPVFVQVLATSNSGDAAVVREVDAFFNADCQLKHDRLHATEAPVANVRLGAAFSAAAHRVLLDVVKRLPEFRAAQPKSAGRSASSERSAKKPKKPEANGKAAKRSAPKDEKKSTYLFQGGNLVIEGPRGAGKTTAVMIAFLNQLDADNDKLQAICMAQSDEEVLRLRDQMQGIAAQMQLVVRACPDDQSAAQSRALFDSKLHVLIGTGEQLHALLQRALLISSLPSVRHFVVFELGAANTTAAFLWEIPTFHCCLRMAPAFQTVLVAERVTDEVLDLCNRLEVDFSLISTVDAEAEESESRSGSKEDGRQTEENDNKQPDGKVLDVGPVRSEDPPTAPVVKELQPVLQTAPTAAPSVPLASAASSTRGSGRSTPIPRYSFLEFNLRPELHAAVKRMGIRTTLSVQRRAIPALLAGRSAVVRAPAGLGTLGVYLLPLLQGLDPAVERVQAIVIEDALLNGYGQCLRFKPRVCLGGELVAEQLRAIAAGVHVVVGVAQRVRAIVESVQFDAQSLRFVVFDELDEQLRTGRETVHAVLRRLAANVQLVFVQREESPGVDETVRKFLADPLHVSGTDEANARTLVEIDSRRTTARVETEGDDEEPEDRTVPAFSEDEEEEESTTETADLDPVQAPNGPLAARLAAAQLRGQLLENRLKELRIYALEEKLGLAHGQPVDVLPPN